MDKIVKTGLKIDLHIHSAASAHKDGVKVKNNTLENIGILIEKLNDNEVNLCSITDHDTFSYDFGDLDVSKLECAIQGKVLLE